MERISDAETSSDFDVSLDSSDKKYLVIGNTNLPNKYVDQVDERIREVIEENQGEMGLTQQMDERVAEIFLAPSKHARDVYTLLWTEGLGSDYDKDQKIDLAAMNQFHHNNSLIADDWMDQDDTRRGVPTFHTSEFLRSEFPQHKVDSLTESQVIKYTTMPYNVIPNSHIPENDQTDVIETLSSNVMNLVEGQNEDLTGNERMVIEDDNAYIESGNQAVSIPVYYYNMVDGKTGALFKASAGSGTIAANYEGEQPEKHALELGRLLQITDDIVDFNPEGDKDHLSDLREAKPTLIVSYGLDRLEDYNRRRLREVLEAEDPADEDLYETEEILRGKGILEKASEKAKIHLENAKKIIDEINFENSEYAQDLNDLTDVIYARSK